MSLLLSAVAPNGTNNSSHTVKPHLKYQDVLIGSILCIGGNLLISVSLNIQKYVHMRIERSESTEYYMRIPMWWLGIFLMVLGETGNFTAYGFAPASMVAPLGTTTVIANMIIAVIFLHEVLRPEDLFGSVLAIIGAFLIVSYSKQNHPVADGTMLTARVVSPLFLSYLCIALASLLVLFIVYACFRCRNVVVLLLTSNVLASFTVVSAKAVSALFQLSVTGFPQWKYPIFYIMFVVLCVTAVLQIIVLNKAMESNYSTVVVPTNFVFFTIAAIIGGIVMFNEFSGLHALDIFMFCLGCILSFVGVFFIQFNRDGDAADANLDKGLPDLDSELSKRERTKRYADGLPAWLSVPTNETAVQPSPLFDYRPIDSFPMSLRRSLPNIRTLGLDETEPSPAQPNNRETDRILVHGPSDRRPNYGAL